MQRVNWQDAVTLLTGIALIAAALFLKIPQPEGISLTPAVWSIALSGLAAVVLAMAALYAFREWEEGVELALGVWLVASPWLLGFQGIEILKWVAVAGGGIIALMALTVLIRPKDRSVY